MVQKYKKYLNYFFKTEKSCTFATKKGHLAEHFQHFVALEGGKADLVFERSHIEHIAIGNITNSWKPYQYYLYNGNYPLRRTIYALLNDTRNGIPSSFTHFIQLPKGQKIILRSGLLPRSANMNVRDVIVKKQ